MLLPLDTAHHDALGVVFLQEGIHAHNGQSCQQNLGCFNGFFTDLFHSRQLTFAMWINCSGVIRVSTLFLDYIRMVAR